MNRRRPLPPYLRLVGDPATEPTKRIVRAPAVSARIVISAATVGHSDAYQRIRDAAVSSIIDVAADEGFYAFDADALRRDIGEVILFIPSSSGDDE
jgi:hypothetical protein